MDLSERFDICYTRTADGAHLGYVMAHSDSADRWVVFLGSSASSVGLPGPADHVDVAPGFLELGNLVMVDLRAIGLSDPVPADFTLEVRVDELIAVLDDLSIDLLSRGCDPFYRSGLGSRPAATAVR
jgi:hypothetical protein